MLPLLARETLERRRSRCREGRDGCCLHPPPFLHLLPRRLFPTSWLSTLTSLFFPRPGWEEALPLGDALSPRGRSRTPAGGRWQLAGGTGLSAAPLLLHGFFAAWWLPERSGRGQGGSCGKGQEDRELRGWKGSGEPAGARSPAGTREQGLCGRRMQSGMMVPASSLWAVYLASHFSRRERKRNGTQVPSVPSGEPPTPIVPGSPERQICPAVPVASLDPTQNRKC